MSAGPYSIGSEHLPGLSKLVEELGEVGQVLGKIVGAGGMVLHWDGSDLKRRLEEELGDLAAAVAFFGVQNGLDEDFVKARMRTKFETFNRWHAEQTVPPQQEPPPQAQKAPSASHLPPEHPTYQDAKALVISEQRASTSFVQRRLQVGYSTAAGWMRQMQAEGVCTEPDHRGVRRMLVAYA